MTNKRASRKTLKLALEQWVALDDVAPFVHNDKKVAKNLLDELTKLGYLEQLSESKRWCITMVGKVFLTKKQERVFKVASIEKQVNAFLKRVEEMNASDRIPYMIVFAKTEGDYPVKQPTGKVTIYYVMVKKKMPDAKFQLLSDQLRDDYAERSDNHFQGLLRPRTIIQKLLKQRSHILHLCEVQDPDDLKQALGTLIYSMI